MLETLIVTAFVSVILIYLFVQISNVTSNYSESFIYNTVDDLYALDDLKSYILSDDLIKNYLSDEFLDDYMIVDTCISSLFTDVSYCQDLLTNLRIEKFIISKNNLDSINFNLLEDASLIRFISTLKSTSSDDYRIIAVFDKDRYASILFDLESL